VRFSTFGMLLIGASLALYACASEEPKPAADSAPASAPAAKSEPAPAPAAPAPPPMVTAPAGTELEVVLSDALSSATNKAGDEFMASVATPVVVGGKVALEKGTKVHGRVVDAQGSGRVKGKASMSLSLVSAVVGGKTVPLVTQAFAQEAEATKGKDAKIVGGLAGAGAVVGGLLGGKKGAAEGAAVGGGAGVGTVLVTKGKEVEFPVESKLKFTLDQAAKFPAN
jgi:hypothetical protein